MNPLSSFRHASFVMFVFTVLMVTLFAISLIPTKTAAITALAQEKQTTATPEQRIIGIGAPAHLPLRIQVKNENSTRWVHDLEIEVTNTSNRPIYFLSFSLIVQGLKMPDGLEVGFWIHYGRPRLTDFSTPLEEGDIPLQPGEKCVLKINEPDADSWDAFRARENKPEPTKVGLVFKLLNFGDGTGFQNAQGEFIDIHRNIGFNQNCLSPPDKSAKSDQTLFLLPGSCTQNVILTSFLCPQWISL